MRVTTHPTRATASDAGFALVSALIVMAIASAIIVTLTVIARSSADRGQDATDRKLGTSAVDQGVTAYIRALNGNMVGEHTGYVFTRRAIAAVVKELDPAAGACASASDRLCYLPNSATPFPNIDGTNIPTGGAFDGRYTVRRRITSGVYHYWQMVALVPPRFGYRPTPGRIAAPGGRVVAYFRGWVGDEAGGVKSKTMIVRAEVRPVSFSDYQVVADGKMRFGPGATINGAVHSNGFDQSFNDQYASQGPMIWFADPSVTCTSTARVTTKSGGITGGGADCGGGVTDPNTGQQVNLLRAKSRVDFLRTMCGRPWTNYTVTVRCYRNTAANRYRITLNGDGTVSVSGYGTVDARDDFVTRTWGSPWSSGSPPQFGAVLIFDRSVEVSGRLGNNGRALVIADNPNAVNLPEPVSIYLRRGGTTGTDGTTTTAAGMIADADIIAIEGDACPLTLRAAVVAMGGMLSMDPRYRGVPVAGDDVCPDPLGASAAFNARGSIAGHLPPYMIRDGGAGYMSRTYQYDVNLYDAPPPMYPTASPYDLIAYRDADLDCFDNTTGRLIDVDSCS